MENGDKIFERIEFFGILDRLRESGLINMFGAPKWLEDNYDLSKEEAREIFMEWTKNGSHSS